MKFYYLDYSITLQYTLIGEEMQIVTFYIMKAIIENTLREKMELERTQHLKAYAIFSANKNLDLNAIANMSVVSVLLAYSDNEAIQAHRHQLGELGQNKAELVLENMIAPLSMVSTELTEAVESRSLKSLLEKTGVKESIKEIIMQEKPEKKVSLKKTKKDLVSYVRYVFDASGTKEDQKMAEKVISKFSRKRVLSVV